MKLHVIGLGLILSGMFIDGLRTMAFFHVLGLFALFLLSCITVGWSISSLHLLQKGVKIPILVVFAIVFSVSMWGEVTVPWSDFIGISLTTTGILVAPLMAMMVE